MTAKFRTTAIMEGNRHTYVFAPVSADGEEDKGAYPRPSPPSFYAFNDDNGNGLIDEEEKPVPGDESSRRIIATLVRELRAKIPDLIESGKRNIRVVSGMDPITFINSRETLVLDSNGDGRADYLEIHTDNTTLTIQAKNAKRLGVEKYLQSFDHFFVKKK